MNQETIVIDGVRYYRLFLLEEPQSWLLSQKGELLLSGGVSEKDITLCRLLLRPLCQFLYEEMCKRSLWNEDGGAGKCVRKMI